MRVCRRIGTGFVVAMLVAGVGSACLMPPPLEQIPPPTNQPPRILPQNLVPAPTFPPATLRDGCPEEFTFEASLADPDGDTIYWRVFVDYFAEVDLEPQFTELPVEPNRSEPIQFNVEKASFGENDLHTVELYIADRPFASGQLVSQGRVLTDPDGLVDTYVWTVVLDDSEDFLCP